MRLVDTDVLIDILRGHAPALAWFGSLAELPAVPGFVVMELIAGCADQRDARRVDRLIAPLPVVWPTESDCRRALSDFRRYRLSHALGMLDAVIAACTTGSGGVLYTFNAKHFAAIPDLVVEQPYAR